MKKLITLTVVAAISMLLVTACNTTQQGKAFNSLYTLEKITVGAYDGYITQVIHGAIPTTGVPTVSSKFNKFQGSYLLALDAVQYNTNAASPVALQVESADLINLITQFTKK
jgi:hypothetical protein